MKDQQNQGNKGQDQGSKGQDPGHGAQDQAGGNPGQGNWGQGNQGQGQGNQGQGQGNQGQGSQGKGHEGQAYESHDQGESRGLGNRDQEPGPSDWQNPEAAPRHQDDTEGNADMSGQAGGSHGSSDH